MERPDGYGDSWATGLGIAGHKGFRDQSAHKAPPG